VRTKRKGIAVVVYGDGSVVVRASKRASEREISDFVESKRRWISEKTRLASASMSRNSELVLEDGGVLRYLGKPYTILRTAADGAAADIRIFGEDMILIPGEYGKPDVAAWLKAEARRVLGARVSLYAEAMGASYTSLRLSNAQARWGSCGAKNSLNFSWRLIMCPIEAIDYVVVHELCHIAHKNHGRLFWASVESVLPDYRKQREWLKANYRLLKVI
jgi:predicted metal-dependent hydrolase